MSQENVELARKTWAAVQRGDYTVAQQLLTADAVIVQPPEVPDAKTYRGREAIRRGWEDWPKQWDDFRLDLIDVIDVSDDVVISVTRQRGRGRESGIDMDFEVYFVAHGRDGMTNRLEMFFSREQALKAAGLEE
jgi:ketosteroid isomerase-like protein